MFGSKKPFFYNVGGFNFSLEDIKHGLLRNNIKPPSAYVPHLGNKDSKLQILSDFFDPRINLVCLDYPSFLEHIDPFDGTTEEKLEEDLDQFVSEIINAKVVIDLDSSSITLPSVFNLYKSDFGGSEDGILQFIFRYIQEEYDYDSIIK
mmetsp:Transcript_3914/g.6639  ORF Transcript_3914/g.6639 Transcript_3914/m.6639 type:complete len:149 (-) Transcript_3914:120-566(-)